MIGTALVAFCFLGSGSSRTWAQSTDPQVYSVERFRLSLGQEGLLGVEWAGVPSHGSWDLALWVGYAKNPLVVFENRDGTRERVGAFVKHRLGGSLVGALALFDWLQVGLDVPIVLHQSRPLSVAGVAGGLSSIGSIGIGSIHVVPKLRILTEEDHGLSVALLFSLGLPSGSKNSYFGDKKLGVRPELALSKTFSALRVGANFGYHVRPQIEFLGLSVDDEIFAEFGAGYSFTYSGGTPASFDFSLATSIAAKSALRHSNQSYAELLAGYQQRVLGFLSLFVAGGLGLTPGHGTPAWRILTGVRLSSRVDDMDGDGIDDDKDACPGEPEDKDRFEDEDGCPDPDNDKDQVPDVTDAAPNMAEDRDGFEDEDGAPDLDNDQDGIPDSKDGAPNEPEDRDQFEDQDGVPDPDNDRDEVLDANDKCPNEAGSPDNDGCPVTDRDNDGVPNQEDQCPDDPGDKNNDGCPDRDGDGVVDRFDNCPDEAGSPANQGCRVRQLVKIAAKKIEILDRVYFASGSARIRRVSFRLLKNVAQVVQAHSEIKLIRIEGHTDNQGRASKNQKLSRRRAEAVRGYLIRRGVSPDRLEAVGFGEKRPIADNAQARGRAENRRVEFIISDKPSSSGTEPAQRTLDDDFE